MNYIIALFIHAVLLLDQYVEWAVKQPGPPGFLFDNPRQRAANVPFTTALVLYFAFGVGGAANVGLIPPWLWWLGVVLSFFAIFAAGYAAKRITFYESENSKNGKNGKNGNT